ncbi:spore germination protein [Alkalihalobacillus sp. LMS39]|uniref:spore germination protein n=1 Tax=Alkalihalobacillus sp. LMS39 TaxID=2924032 RepID=UPI001FB1C91E|nr:spore germination protein [Alkalihalobacillus sp. LMS39]UOE96255.1 spore germination protein [Alkalihalobacillus sp. LMS39]
MSIYRKILSSMVAKKNKDKTKSNFTPGELIAEGESQTQIKPNLQENKDRFTSLFHQSFDFYQEPIQIGKQTGLAIYMKTMVDLSRISQDVKQSLTLSSLNQCSIESKEELTAFQKEYFSSHFSTILQYEHEVVWHILSGYIVLFVENVNFCIAVHVANDEKRAIEKSDIQTIIRGPQDSFTESLLTNMSLVRKRIKNPNLVFEQFIVGHETRTDICVSYISNIANEEIVNEVKRRISSIKMNAILDSGQIEDWITDKTLTPFPLTYHSERPDAIASKLIGGKIVIFVDGSPFVTSVPVVFADFFQASEDYYQHFMMSSFIRILRYIAFCIAIGLPGLYIGLTSFHHELIPTNLLISMQAQREGVPFPAFIELLLMEITFEILREAGVRMPRVVGQTVSIVGALVIGQAAVEAGIVSNVLVIVVALTAMATFVSPIYSFANSARLLRFGIILVSAGFGIFGTLFCLLITVIHLVSLRSFGVPYLAAIAPFIVEDNKDVFVRFPIKTLKERPKYLNTKTSMTQSNKGEKLQ